jgi:hypothetical protein
MARLKALPSLSQRIFLCFLFGQHRISMELGDSLIPRVNFSFGFNPYLLFLKKPEIIPFPVGKRGTDHPLAFLVNNNLHFYRVPLFLPGMPELLPLFGSSTSVSAGSTRMTSYSASLLSNSLLPDSENSLDCISVSSAQRINLYA